MRKRLGCAGSERLRILEAIAGQIPANEVSEAKEIGLGQRELSALSNTYDFRALARGFPNRGDTESFSRIAWWGSAWGDVACAIDEPHRDLVLREAALFNLGVALFDSVIDERPDLKGSLVKAITPSLMRRRLQLPNDRSESLTSENLLLNHIVRLFDTVLSSIGRRISGQQQSLNKLAALLQTMYESELCVSSDPFLAKKLPLVFIGALTTRNDRAAVEELFESLGEFIHLWDDWLDIADDIIRLAPNAFISSKKFSVGIHGIHYLAHGLARVLLGRCFHGRISESLALGLARVIHLAGQVDPVTSRQVATLCNHLVI